MCFADTTGIRELPPTYRPNSLITVILHINVEPGTTGVIVIEKISDDLTMVETMDYPKKIEHTDDGYVTYSWIAFHSESVPPFSIRYQLYVPPTASGDYQFQGYVLTADNPQGNEISGNDILRGNLGDINRGIGFMLGMELNVPATDFVKRCRNNGLLLNCTHNTVVRIMPPLCANMGHLKKAINIIKKSLIEEFES